MFCQVARKDSDAEAVFMWDSHPLFYESLLHDYFIKNVIDLTPGSGVLAFVCIEQRVGCICICMSEAHAAGIRNCLLTKIVAGMSKEGSKLYQPKFAKLLKDDPEKKPTLPSPPKPGAKPKSSTPKSGAKKGKLQPTPNDGDDDGPKPKKPRTSSGKKVKEAEDAELSDFNFSDLDEDADEEEEENEES